MFVDYERNLKALSDSVFTFVSIRYGRRGKN